MNATMLKILKAVEILGEVPDAAAHVVNGEALDFIHLLHQHFFSSQQELLRAREMQQENFDQNPIFEFPQETKGIRDGQWKIAPVPSWLQDRRVEITGPVSRKMVIQALNSGANVFMADFEDSTSPTWTNIIMGQKNLYDAVRGHMSYTDPHSNKTYQLQPDQAAVLFVRPRGLHLVEKHITINGQPTSASLTDFGLFLFNNAQALITKGFAPCFYLPKLEHYREAFWWNQVFEFAQERLHIPKGTIKATVLIETLPAAFNAEEILYALREHSAGLNCGRWDYIFSIIKKYQRQETAPLPDRSEIHMEVPMMSAYARHIIKTCHKRNAHAMGGMAAQIPIKNDPEKAAAALEKVRLDKLREVQLGHDGTWVAHPGLIAIAKSVFDQYMPTANQIHKVPEWPDATTESLTEWPTGIITEVGLRNNIQVGLQYISAWLSGTGAAAIHHLMEDAATAEICRSQIWQWIQLKAKTNSGQVITPDWFLELSEQEASTILINPQVPEDWKKQLSTARKIFNYLVTSSKFKNFLTEVAYPHL
jgi:malate synthase